MSTQFVAPSHGENTFTCPYVDCRTYSQMQWKTYHKNDGHFVQNIRGSRCVSCHKVGLWVNEQLVYPVAHLAPPPVEDMPGNVLDLYEEARAVLNDSARAAAALLRLAVEHLVRHILKGDSADHLYTDIGKLVERGLLPKVQQSLDAVRVIGNNMVHPGKITFDDDREVALALFPLVNIIVEQMIAHPKQVSDLYENMIPDRMKRDMPEAEDE